ncbi:MAG: DNA recombination protein RmuC [Ruminococcaceae bacterium]|nr:DNA recombination protein RmuC [Oscillospiraceae bacterium]
MEMYITWGLLAVVLVLLLAVLLRRPQDNGSEARLREEIRALRRENAESRAAEQDRLYQTLNTQSDRLNRTLSEAVARLQESNEQKLEQMRATVDEKLTATLQKRLDTSFQAVGEQLQNVYRSLGEMKELAGGVNDLQRVLSNVKVRGTWAEVQLGSLLEQTLTADQFERNVSVRGNNERVEFAVKIPSREEEGQFVYLPIDSKFPQEDYLRLSEAADRADGKAVEEAAKALEHIIKKEAADIARLYINVPVTTDFAILFLPTEGLYAEVLRRPGLAEELQQKYRVMVCGPTTVTAFLNTLRMGFRTIALDRRAAEVWKVLGAAKAQYEKFGVALDKIQRKIEEAGNTLEDARNRNRIIQKNLRGVEELAPAEAETLLELPTGEE